MTRQIACVLCSVWILAGAAPSQLPDDDRAVLVVTGTRVEGNPPDETRDLTVAEGAIVKLTAQDRTTREKRTAVFERSGRKFYTADFAISLETTYDIVMTFKNGTVIRIADYRLPRDWRTHLLFHSTRGTKSPASILRKQKDEKTQLECDVYALWPLESYRAMGGRQVGPQDH